MVLQSGGFITNVASTPTEQPDQNRRTVARPNLLLAVCVCHPESLQEFNRSEQQGFNLRNSRRIAVSIAYACTADVERERSSSPRRCPERARMTDYERCLATREDSQCARKLHHLAITRASLALDRGEARRRHPPRAAPIGRAMARPSMIAAHV